MWTGEVVHNFVGGGEWYPLCQTFKDVTLICHNFHKAKSLFLDNFVLLIQIIVNKIIPNKTEKFNNILLNSSK